MLYIRHGPKMFRNSITEPFGLDPALTPHCDSQLITTFTFYLDQYGPPSSIVSSPYYRCHQTALLAQQAIEHATGVHVPISFDSQIGEYLGNQKQNYSLDKLRPSTLVHHPIPPETLLQFKQRVSHHKKSAKSDTWYITHGLFIQFLYQYYTSDRFYPDFLSGFYVNGPTVSKLPSLELTTLDDANSPLVSDKIDN